VFTHVYKEQTEYYLGEIARILTEYGIARTTWFLFDRSTFPMLFDFQVSLFINECDPTNAVIYDWQWLLDCFAERTEGNPHSRAWHQRSSMGDLSCQGLRKRNFV